MKCGEIGMVELGVRGEPRDKRMLGGVPELARLFNWLLGSRNGMLIPSLLATDMAGGMSRGRRSSSREERIEK